jgi:DNA primase catalytic subunit
MRFSVPGFCLCWHIADGEVAKMTDEERRELVAYLRNPGHDFRGDKALAEEILVAADEIERLAGQLRKSRARVRELETEAGYVVVRS